MQNALIIFVRHPELGKVKTRLAATVGDAAALHIYKKLLAHTRHITEPVQADKFVFYTTPIAEQDIWTGDRYFKCTQSGGDLGHRMQHAFQEVLTQGYSRVLIIGSDCVDLTTGIIENGFAQLTQNDLVIGPATDGGYYLLGLKKMYPELFTNKRWSTSSVYADTLLDVQALGLTCAVLPTLNDVDEEKDVPVNWLAEF